MNQGPFHEGAAIVVITVLVVVMAAGLIVYIDANESEFEGSTEEMTTPHQGPWYMTGAWPLIIVSGVGVWMATMYMWYREFGLPRTQ